MYPLVNKLNPSQTKVAVVPIPSANHFQIHLKPNNTGITPKVNGRIINPST